MMSSLNQTKNLQILFTPILYINISQFEQLKKNPIFLLVKKTLTNNYFFLRFEQLKKIITKIGEKRIRRFVVWFDELINEFVLYFLAWISNMRSENMFFQELTVAHQQIACLWINLNWFAYNSYQSSPCMKMMFVHAHMNSAISPLWTFFWTFTIKVWAGDFENHLT